MRKDVGDGVDGVPTISPVLVVECVIGKKMDVGCMPFGKEY